MGGGPAGLTAAKLLAEVGWGPVVLEADPRYLGGISRTVEQNGYRFDIGGHRFFSKAPEVREFWRQVLPEDMLLRPRKSRIFYGGRFFSYPLRPIEALLGLGLTESLRCLLSYTVARLRARTEPRSFEDWVSGQFGRRLYEIFFKVYTEKVWGMSCSEISADWAAQRINKFSLVSAVLRNLRWGTDQPVAKTLIEEFHYPRLGPGMLWETCGEQIRQLGGEVLLGHRVRTLERVGSEWRVAFTHPAGHGERMADHVICTASLRDTVKGLRPAAPVEMAASASALRYRDFISVALIVHDEGGFDDNWIYVQDPEVRVGRIQNFGAWSPEMVPEAGAACYGLEYFCFDGDDLWKTKDRDLVALAAREMTQIGLLRDSQVIDACVVRQPKAYPIYDQEYEGNVNVIRRFLEEHYPGLHMIGRNGMHRYNNQDHSMMTAMLTVRNLLAGEPLWDPWLVNQDAEYIESGPDAEAPYEGGRLMPRPLR